MKALSLKHAGPSTQSDSSAPRLLQRKCACGASAGASGVCSACSQREVQRKARGRGDSAAQSSSVEGVLRSPGDALDSTTQDFMEQRLGYDFSNVRVHADGSANASAEGLDAHAFTSGTHVVFGQGQYRPETTHGRRLIAHELAHVVQQRSSLASVSSLSETQRESAEREADTAADVAMRPDVEPSARPALGSVTRGIQRKAASDGDELNSEPDHEVYDGDVPTPAGERAGPLSEAELEGESELDAVDDDVQFPALVQKDPKKPKSAPKTKKKAPPPRKITKVAVSLSAQTLTLTWSDGKVDKAVAISSGKGLPDTKDDPCKDPSAKDSNCTPSGNFTPGVRGGADYTNDKGAAMSWYVQFEGSGASGRGIGVHNSQPVTGSPASHGCVRVNPSTAKTINKNVTNSTEIAVDGKAPTVPWSPPKKKEAPKKATKK